MSFTLQYFLIYCFPFTIVIILLKSVFSSSKANKNLPPSPTRLPLIGNLHQLGSFHHRSLQAMAKTYGSLMLIRLGSVPVLVASSVDAAREIMKTHDLIFSNRPILNMPNKLVYGSKDIAFSQYGEHWRQMKSIAVVHLFTNKRVQSFRLVREEETALIIEKIYAARESVVNLSEFLISLTNKIICRVALGRTYDVVELNSLLERWWKLLGSFSVGSYIPWLTWVDRLSGLERRADEVAKEFDEFLEGVIEDHINKRGVGTEIEDLVDILLEILRDNMKGFRLKRDAIKAIILDVFAAGTDSTSSNLIWALSELIKHPQTMEILQQEAHKIGQGRSMITEDDLDNMPYLKAVLKETLRLHTPAPLLIPRESIQDFNLLGYDITAGTQVMINVWAIARDASIWEEPDEFRPERFLDSPIDYQGLHFEFLPFGAGRRRCPGIQFAMSINELVLANLVYKFNFALPGGKDLDTSEIMSITIHKKCPILVATSPCC